MSLPVAPIADMQETVGNPIAAPAIAIPSTGHDYDPRHAATAAVISGLAYKRNGTRLDRQTAHLGAMETFDSKNQRVIVIGNAKAIWVAFEGSDPATRDDYLLNLNHTHTPHPIGGFVHQGFRNRLLEPVLTSSADAASGPIIDAVHKHIVKLHHYFPEARLHFTGHSSGGASAVLQAAHLALKDPALAARAVGSITTFGQPRVGNQGFYEAFRQHYNDKYQRFTLPYDLVTTLPPRYSLGSVSLYQHGGVQHPLVKPHQSEEDSIAPPLLARKERGVAQRIIGFLRQHHGIGAYLDACLAPTGVNGKQFVKQFFADQFMPIEDIDIRPPFDGCAKEYLLHCIDMLEHYRPAIADTADAAQYDASAQALRAIRDGFTQDTMPAAATLAFGTIATRLIPCIGNHANERNGLQEMGMFLRWIEHEALRPTPTLMQVQDFVRELGDMDMQPLPAVDRESLDIYASRLQEMLGEHIAKGTTPTGHMAERMGYIMRHISRVLEPHLHQSPAFANASRQADGFRKAFADIRSAHAISRA